MNIWGTSFDATTLAYAFFGGLVPSLIWLYYLLKEDARHPEPKKLIIFAFITGIAAIPFALRFEQMAKDHLSGDAMLIAWALIEEILKYLMAAIFILWRHAVDETPDYVIYMITVALGFASAENMLFLLAPLSHSQYMTAFFTGDLRFLGSTLLHVVASAAIGLALGFSAGDRPPARVFAASVGLMLAVSLHTAFNVFIMKEGTSSALLAFFLVWTAAVAFFAAFEVLKYLQYRKFPNPPSSFSL